MIFLLLATIFFASVAVALYYKCKDLKLELELEKRDSIAISDRADKLAVKFNEATDSLIDSKCKMETLENSYTVVLASHKSLVTEVVKLQNENVKLSQKVEELSQKELIQECRMFWNHLHQTRNRINSAVESIEKEFVKVKRIYEAQTTVDECVTNIKPVKVEFPTSVVSGQIDISQTKHPFTTKIWNRSEE